MMNVEKITNEIIEFIRKYYKDNNLKGAVIGISGGKDSAVVAGLFAKALGSENVQGLWLPCHSKIEDKNNAYLVANHFGFDLKEIDLTNIYDNFVNENTNGIKDEYLIDANINLKPRLRTATLYYQAAMLSRKSDATYIVPGTSNACELYVGYFTKGGDNVSDIMILANLSVREVIKIGEYIGVPDKVVHKTPDDGLSGLTDEEKLGFKYNDVEKVMKGEYVLDSIKQKIMKMHNQNKHKFITPTYKVK